MEACRLTNRRPWATLEVVKLIVLDKNQRKGLATALYSLGNIVAASLIIGQLVGAGGFRLLPFALGLLLFMSAYVIATKLNREEPR